MTDPLPLEAEPETVAAWRGAGIPVAILDVREPWEADLCRIEGSIHIPLRELGQRTAELPADGRLVVVCHHGGRSAQATLWLRSRGLDSAINLAGGIDRWAIRIDPQMRRY